MIGLTTPGSAINFYEYIHMYAYRQIYWPEKKKRALYLFTATCMYDTIHLLKKLLVNMKVISKSFSKFRYLCIHRKKDIYCLTIIGLYPYFKAGI